MSFTPISPTPISVITPRNVPSRTAVVPKLTFVISTVLGGTSILKPLPTVIPIPDDVEVPNSNTTPV